MRLLCAVITTNGMVENVYNDTQLECCARGQDGFITNYTVTWYKNAIQLANRPHKYKLDSLTGTLYVYRVGMCSLLATVHIYIYIYIYIYIHIYIYISLTVAPCVAACRVLSIFRGFSSVF